MAYDKEYGDVTVDFGSVFDSYDGEVTKERYIDDPIVTGGCPMCGTYLYQSKRSEPVRSRAINYGRNEDRTALKDNKYVRCGKCGFICHTQRDLESKKRAHIGWGLKYTEIEAGG